MEHISYALLIIDLKVPRFHVSGANEFQCRQIFFKVLKGSGQMFDFIFQNYFLGCESLYKLLGYCMTMHFDNCFKSSNEIAEAANQVFWKTVNQRIAKRPAEDNQ